MQVMVLNNEPHQWNMPRCHCKLVKKVDKLASWYQINKGRIQNGYVQHNEELVHYRNRHLYQSFAPTPNKFNAVLEKVNVHNFQLLSLQKRNTNEDGDYFL